MSKMKNKTIFKRVAAMMMAGAMMAAMGTSVMAAPADTQTNVITKKITKGEYDYAPNTSFQFSISPVTDGLPAGYYEGIADAVSLANNGVISSAPKASDIGSTEITVGTAGITVDTSKFTNTGVYRYVVSEAEGEYEGITYDTETRYFDVYVINGSEEGKLDISYMFVGEAGKDDGVFTNDYDGKNDSLHDLTVKKTVTGNQGDKSKNFEFTILVNGAEGEQYYVIFSDNSSPITLKSGESATIALSHNETATIYGLSASDSYTVTETDYSGDGYTTTIGEETTKTATGTITSEKEIEVVNNRQVTTPTGLVMDIAPYLLMVAAAIVLAVVFFRKRSYAER